MIATLREVLLTEGACERAELIGRTARSLGYRRVGKVLAGDIGNAIRTAKRRGVLRDGGGLLHVERLPLSEWDREFLKDQFLASLSQGGRIWVHRDDAVRDFARWLGCRRTGRVIAETARSIINGLLRDGRIEKDGQEWLRRV